MANANQFVPWATQSGANVLTNAAYQSAAARLVGFAIGIVDPPTFNSILRQGTFVAAAVSQFVADYGPADVNDDGIISEYEASLVAAIKALVPLALPTYLQSASNSMTLSSVTSTQLGVAAGMRISDDNAVIINSPSAFIKLITANWAQGNGSTFGLIDTGTPAAGTWYHVYSILNPTTAVVDMIATATFGSPTLPSGFTKKKYIGLFQNGAWRRDNPAIPSTRDAFRLGYADPRSGRSYDERDGEHANQLCMRGRPAGSERRGENPR